MALLGNVRITVDLPTPTVLIAAAHPLLAAIKAVTFGSALAHCLDVYIISSLIGVVMGGVATNGNDQPVRAMRDYERMSTLC